MSRLTNEDFMEIQTFIDRAKAQFEQHHLEIEVDTDLSKWVEFNSRAPDAIPAPSTHDPSKSNVHAGNSFWVLLRETNRPGWAKVLRRAPLVVGCGCHRVIETDDIIEDIRTYRLFFDKKPVVDYRPINIVATKDSPVIGGKVGFTGGFWIHPKYRGAKVSGALSRMVRLLSIRHFDIDWTINLTRDTADREAMFNKSYGFPNSMPIIKGYYPPYGRDYDMRMNYMHRDEILQQLRNENAKAVKSGANVEPSVH